MITDYASYPSFNAALIEVEVVTKDENGAEFLADRKTSADHKTRIGSRSGRSIGTNATAISS